MNADPTTIYGLTRSWAEWLDAWSSWVTVGGALVLAVLAAIGSWGTVASKEFSRRETDPKLFDTKEYRDADKLVIEIHPHGAVLHPFVILVPASERSKLLNVATGPTGSPPGVAMVLGKTDIDGEGGAYKGLQIESPVDRTNSAYVYFSSDPSELLFGQRNGELHRVRPH
jgi:hypothetical protein